MNFYNHHIGDYLKKTAHLSVTQHGAYFLLMQHFYATEAPLPTDKSSLYRIAKAETKPERNAVDSVIQQFWKKADGGLVNGRAQEEIAKASKARDAARENGRNGGRPKKTQPVSSENPSGSNIETHSVISQNPVGSRNETQTEPSPIKPSGKALQPPTSNHQTYTQNHRLREFFAEAQGAYPPRSGRVNWTIAERNFYQLVTDGADPDALIQGVKRYAAFVAAGGVTSGRYVLGPDEFFGAVDHPWSQSWDPPTAQDSVRKTRFDRDMEALNAK